MTVKGIIKLVCEFVGERELLKKLDMQNPVYSTRESEKLETMIKCFNLVNQEIASDYLPFLLEEEIDVRNSILNFSSLSKNVVAVYQVKDCLGFGLKFRNYPNYVEIFGAAKKIVYSYLPAELELDAQVESNNGLSERVYAYGVASEYLLVDGMSDDAEIWEERFKESLFMLSRRHGEHRLPRRRWC